MKGDIFAFFLNLVGKHIQYLGIPQGPDHISLSLEFLLGALIDLPDLQICKDLAII